jgi:hypothetical protein
MPRLRLFLIRTVPTLALALSVLAAPATAGAGPSPSPGRMHGADLGRPTGLTIADGTNCGNYFPSATLDRCDSAIKSRKLILGWKFDAERCADKPCQAPDGFNVMREPYRGGPASVFWTQKVASQDLAAQMVGTVVPTSTDENAGECFYVVPFRGADDVGRRSKSVCLTDKHRYSLRALRTVSAHFGSYNNGTSCKSPSSNPGGYAIVFSPGARSGGNAAIAGYVTRSGGISVAGAFADALDPAAQIAAAYEAGSHANDHTCNHYRDVFQALIYFDLGTVSGKTISKATLDVPIDRGAWNAGSSRGGDGAEHEEHVNCATTLGTPLDGNPSLDAPVPFHRVKKLHAGTASALRFDLTAAVRDWTKPGAVNRGIVLSPSYLNPTLPVARGRVTQYNADCITEFGTPTLTVDTMQL